VDKFTEQVEMSDSLLRQRRNLIISSLVICFLLYTNVEISKISIFSIVFRAPKPDELMSVLWLIWFYFLVRYYQYLVVEPAIGIKIEFARKFALLCSNVFLKRFIEKYAECNLNITDFSPNNLKRKSFLEWELPIDIYDPIKGKKVEYEKEIVRIHLMAPSFIKSAWYVFMHTPRFTDYAFPFILAVLTGIYGMFQFICV